MANFKILGFSEDFTSCDRCGKMELKGTYAISTEHGELFRLGSSCIKKAYQLTQKEFTSKLNFEKTEAAQKFYDELKTAMAPFKAAIKRHNWDTPEFKVAFAAANEEEERVISELRLKYPLAPISAAHFRPNHKK